MGTVSEPGQPIIISLRHEYAHGLLVSDRIIHVARQVQPPPEDLAILTGAPEELSMIAMSQYAAAEAGVINKPRS